VTQVRRGARFAITLGALVLASAASGLGVEAASTLPLPGPAPRPRTAGGDPAADNRACEACHADVAAEWRGSLHHQSWDDPVFLSAYALEQRAFCRACHVPEADPDEVPSASARRLGVGCVTCHVAGADIIGVRARPATSQAHAVRGDARLATAAACEGCHQFEFPEPHTTAMQGTVAEHRASPFAATSCQECHMPRVADAAGGAPGRTRRSHDFRVLGDTALLRSAVRASARITGESTVTVTLASGRVGHAVPTGDMFRRLEVRASLAGQDGARARPVVLGRRFRVVPGPRGPERHEIGDDRLPASGAPREVRLELPQPIAGHAVHWQVAYQRMEAGMALSFGVDPAVDEVILAEGQLGPEAAACTP